MYPADDKGGGASDGKGGSDVLLFTKFLLMRVRIQHTVLHFGSRRGPTPELNPSGRD
jgi:hypothetical protein